MTKERAKSKADEVLAAFGITPFGQELTKNTVESYKPRYPKDDIKTALRYLVRVVDQDLPNYDFILNLASFATTNKLSDKQLFEAKKIINYYAKKGIL